MADNETIADVLAAMRDEGRTGESSCLEWVGAKMRHYADRLEAAHKLERENYDAKIADLQLRVKLWTDRSDELVEKCVEQYAKLKQVGSAAKLRDALVQVQKKINYLIGNLTVPNSLVANRMEINGIINAALAAPPRNCDVGSVAEQKERFKDFCKEGKLSRIDLGAYCTYDCPCRDSYDCKLEWAQMPFEEGGEK